MRMNRTSLFILFLATAGFVFGLVHLFRLRFEAGDVYPAYSSLRADPLGAKALYQSLGKLLPARRHYQPLSKLGESQASTLFYLGAEREDLRFDPEELKHLENFVAGGGRLVLSLFPSYSSRASRNTAGPFPAPPPNSGPGQKKTPAPQPRKAPADDRSDLPDLRKVTIQERWGVDFAHAALPKDEDGNYVAARAFRQTPAALPESIACHTALFFTNLAPGWRVVYARKPDRPVLIERRLGDGAVVLCADSYPFSNEALLKDRLPELLTWFVGPARRVVFDETHLGVQESAGVAALGRKYRLHGLFAGLLLLAALFVWKNSVSLVPPYESAAQDAAIGLVAGKESAAGFVNLLRRNIPAREILGVCLAEWKKSCAHGQPRAKLEQIQAVIDAENTLSPKERNPIRTYRAIGRILGERKGNVMRDA